MKVDEGNPGRFQFIKILKIANIDIFFTMQY